MTTSGCAEFADAAPELALGLLSGGERAEALLHLAGCVHCQAVVAELGATVDAVMSLVPGVEPPAGFGARAVDAMTGWQVPRRRRLRLGGLVAASVAAASIVSIVAVRVADRDRPDGAVVEVAEPRLRATAMIAGTGSPAGRVVVNGRGDRVALMVTVDYAVPDGTYAVTVGSGAKTTGGREIGTLEVASGRGWWSGVALVPSRGGWVALVDEAGQPLCESHFDRLEPATS